MIFLLASLAYASDCLEDLQLMMWGFMSSDVGLSLTQLLNYVPNKPTVSADVKQHFNQPAVLSGSPRVMVSVDVTQRWTELTRFAA